MKLKSLLLGSAAALVAVSGARAADAVVIPEPEAVEYVRVCDAAGAGYFYIPGSETCLKFSGYVQYQIGFQDGQTGWDKATEARLQIDSWTDSEFGAVTTLIRLTNQDGSGVSDFRVDRAVLSIGGLSMGLMGALWDYSATGAADSLIGTGYTANAIQYKANFGGGSFAIQLLDDATFNWVPDVVAKAEFAAGDVKGSLGVAYDESAAAWSAKGHIGYMGFGAIVQYSSAASSFSGSNQWVLGANYGFDATDKLNLNLGVAYGFQDAVFGAANWTVGAEAAYKLTNTFTVSARARVMDGGNWDGRIRFKASF